MDSGLVIVTFITFVYIVIMFTLLFYVKYEWCDLLYKNNTVSVLSFFFLMYKKKEERERQAVSALCSSLMRRAETLCDPFLRSSFPFL